jgi:hypothetical protein
MNVDEIRKIREAHYATLGLFGDNKIRMPEQPESAEDSEDGRGETLDDLREKYTKISGKPPNQRWSASHLEKLIRDAEAEIALASSLND